MTQLEIYGSILVMNGAEPYSLSIGDVAERTGLHVSTVRAYADAGKLRCRRLPSGHRRFRESDVDAFLSDAQPTPEPAQ